MHFFPPVFFLLISPWSHSHPDLMLLFNNYFTSAWLQLFLWSWPWLGPSWTWSCFGLDTSSLSSVSLSSSVVSTSSPLNGTDIKWSTKCKKPDVEFKPLASMASELLQQSWSNSSDLRLQVEREGRKKNLWCQNLLEDMKCSSWRNFNPAFSVGWNVLVFEVLPRDPDLIYLFIYFILFEPKTHFSSPGVSFQVRPFLHHSHTLLHRMLHQGQRTQTDSALWLAVARAQLPLLLVSHTAFSGEF